MIESMVLGVTVGTKSEIEGKLRAEAEAANAAFLQYAGLFKGFALGRAKTTVRTKLGVAVEKGELVIFRTELDADPRKAGKTVATFWSRANQCLTSVASEKVEAVS